VTVVASASGTRIDCDRCGSHAASPDLAVAVLRNATGFVRRDDQDLCPDCYAETAREDEAEHTVAA
jgi:hypothetical protein